jgi:hypothetical protein
MSHPLLSAGWKHDTGAARRTPGVADAATERACLEKLLGETLRLHVAAWIQISGEAASLPQVVEACAEVGEVIVVRHALLEPLDFRQLYRLVKRDLRLRRGELEARVPRASIGSAEPRAERMRVTERER